MGSCQYVEKDAAIRGNEESTYSDLLHIRDYMADDLAIEFGNDPDQIRSLPFNYFAGFPDIIFAENFEGIPTKHVNWTDTELDYVHQILNAVLLNPFSEKSKQLFVTKQFNAPFNDIKKLSDFEYSDVPKYRLYSAHDTNVAVFLDVFKPPFTQEYIPYAANFILEVYERRENDLFVRFMYNGEQLTLDNCSMADCSIYEFIVHMEQVLFMYDLEKECAKEPEPSFLKFLQK